MDAFPQRLREIEDVIALIELNLIGNSSPLPIDNVCKEDISSLGGTMSITKANKQASTLNTTGLNKNNTTNSKVTNETKFDQDLGNINLGLAKMNKAGDPTSPSFNDTQFDEGLIQHIKGLVNLKGD